MAELPDLTVFAQILDRRFKGKTLEQLEVTVSKKINVSAAELKAALEGKIASAGKVRHCSCSFRAGRF